MKVLNYIAYMKEAKVGDIIILGGTGIMDGIKHRNKFSSLTVARIDLSNDGNVQEVFLRRYRCQNLSRVQASYRDQDVAVLTKKEFQTMPLY